MAHLMAEPPNVRLKISNRSENVLLVREVLTGYQLGKSYREIATELRCKTKSVDNALARIKRKVSGVSPDPLGWDDL